MQVKKSLVLVAIVAVVAAVIVGELNKGQNSTAPAKSAGATLQEGPVSERTLTPPWPPATDQATSVSKDLFAKNYYVVLDGSGSMKDHACSGDQSKMEAAKAALGAFADSVPADANLGLQVFDEKGVKEWLPLDLGNREKFIGLVNQVRASGGTPLRDSVSLAYGKLLEQGRKQLGYGEYHLVIVTDGEANPGQDPTLAVNTVLKESPIVLSTIGFCIGNNHSLNQPGRTMYKAADNPGALRQGLADVLAEAPKFAVTKFK